MTLLFFDGILYLQTTTKGDEEMIKVYTTWDWDNAKHTTMVYNEEGHKIHQTQVSFTADFDTVYMFHGRLYTLSSIKDDGKYFIFDEYGSEVKGLLTKDEVDFK